ncbi:MAG TPA: UDP-N-acetylglucosamine 2-epimerase (non-hydrolyzing) [Burkholderiales bacterium]|nr:UDP-N-acetylglucosamine 2-epimerase (non-hydrolyzing) [Burkholderiales bacterium]
MTLCVDLIAAARPNFMKVAPLYRALAEQSQVFRPRLVHTGQHYDDNMSGAFFRDLGLPAAHAHLGVGAGTHAQQTGGVMIAYEALCARERPDLTIVVGDVNSTAACTLAAAKLNIAVAHLEAGLRSGDRSMPEEINRIVTDALADVLWTPSPDADENLLREGVPSARISCVGNIMIDALELGRSRIESRPYARELGLRPREYAVVTLHRPSNVDDPGKLQELVRVLSQCSAEMPLVFPVHPRTRKSLIEFGLWARIEGTPGLHAIEPLGYVEFMSLVFTSAAVVTDSGGLQEETTYLGIPCVTLRDNTERPVTLAGTNRLARAPDLPDALHEVRSGRWPRGQVPELWDGRTASRIICDLKRRFF